MKMKKLLSALIAGAMVVGTMSFPVFAEETDTNSTVLEEPVSTTPTDITAVAKIGDVEYETLADAIAAVKAEGNTEAEISILGDVSLVDLASTSGLTKLTLTGNGTQTFDIAGKTQAVGAELIFNKLIINDDNDNYTGIQHCPAQTFNDCTINGQFFAYALDTKFIGCTFNQTSADSYNIWTYGANDILFDSCVFNCAGKCVLVYCEDSSGDKTATLDNCEFVASAPVTGKAAIEIDSRFSKYTVQVNGCTATNFDQGSVSQSTLWNNKLGNKTMVFVDGTVAYTDYLFMIGETYYETLAEAVDAAVAGDTITLVNDINEVSTIEIPSDKNIVLDLNGYSINAAVRADNAAKHYYAIDNYGTLVLEDSVGTGTISARGIENLSGGKMTINGGTYLSIDKGNGGAAVWNEGDLVINGGAFKSTYRGSASDQYGAGCLNNSGTALITGGTFEGESARTYAIISTGKLEVTPGEGKEVNVSGVHGGISADSGSLVINGGNYSSEEYYGLYVSNDGTGGNPQNAFATVNGGTFDGHAYSVWIGSDINNPVNSSIEINGGTFKKPLNAQENTRDGAILVSGGTFATDVKEYVANGYYSKANEDGIYTVTSAEAKVIDTAKTTGAEVTLDGLHKSDAVDPTADATYKVVVSTAPKADAEKANAKIKADGDTNTDKAIFDISIEKTDSTGVTTDISKQITDQKVTLTLGEKPQGNVKVYHVTDTGADYVGEYTPVGNTVTFIAPGFSTYAVTYNTAAADPNTITDKIGVVFSPVSEGSNQYYITLKSLKADKKINRFMSTDLVFVNNSTGLSYEIEPAANVKASVVSENNKSREYRFNMDGLMASSATSEIGEGITIGTIIFDGYGTLDFKVDTTYTSGHAINIVNTAKASDNIVENYTIGGASELVVNDDVTENLASDESGKITGEIKAATKDLTINVAFNNAVEGNVEAYQAMKIVISGGDLDDDITIPVKDAMTNNTFTTVVADKLTQNTTYTVTVSGDGYRTARYTVTMTEDKTLNFWNNVKDGNHATEMITGDGNAVTKNFLAGEIVKDNQINIYDLSAVVSYFGKTGLKAANDYDKFVRYDLNRDGKIDSKDVAYVLVSWGE